MTGALRAEYRKLVTTKVWIWLSLLAIGLTLLIAILFALNVDKGAPDAQLPLASIIAGGTSFGYLIAAVMGVIGLTGEFRHLTATPTFLSVPRRGTVVSAKLITYLLYGLLLGAVVIALAVAVGGSLLSNRGFELQLGSETMARVIIGNLASVMIFGVIGVGVGALLKNQVAAVVGLVLYLFVFENIISVIPGVQKAWPYLPGGAQAALTQTVDTTSNIPDGLDLLSSWQGGALLLAYGLVFAVAGSWLAVRRDIT